MERIIGALVAIALAILAVGNTLSNSGQAKSDQKSSGAATDIGYVMTKARAGFAQSNNGYANFKNSNLSGLINGGTFPPTMVRGAGIFDKWGNPITLSSANSGTSGVISFGGGGSQTTDECTSTVTSMSGYDLMTVGGGGNFTRNSMPDTAQAGAVCSATATIVVTFH
ncbi:prepilin type IV pili [Ralstonia solanacearum]|uniref:type 4 pilus major pilin n=1 Tax=Ralstonia solanacearum TaxID=305 RepID=UPI0005C43786|nr:type 4 pilus major pilin [Ralstonia solanacearum]MBB6592751.1 prepilin type IV pili [Ralstonia solanacearum]MBB6596973.1 prepilin type IV pili [Ralstonia solanacearum]MDB0541217.1 prepilin type IV pili [Ralstonia solanacearum]MDB0551409.1 prepilin type IV pili [Ralstonia solanacearum]MDB0556166.1 prepilin type IV pili [Ralstonia solanacearum]